MAIWYETKEAIRAMETADERMTEMQKEREVERTRRCRAEERVSRLSEALVSIAENNTGGLDAATYAYAVLNPD